MYYENCCERGSIYLQPCKGDNTQIEWLLWPADGSNEAHEVRFCPFCGHDLSRPVQTLEEDLEAVLASPVPLYLCFDVDGVLADDRGLRPYAEREPYPWVTSLLTRLRLAGHHILIQTARYMLKCHGNQRLAHEAGYEELQAWLVKYDIPFDRIYLGKVSADVYVDDRGCRVESRSGTIDWERNFVPLLAATQDEKRK